MLFEKDYKIIDYNIDFTNKDRVSKIVLNQIKDLAEVYSYTSFTVAFAGNSLTDTDKLLLTKLESEYLYHALNSKNTEMLKNLFSGEDDIKSTFNMICQTPACEKLLQDNFKAYYLDLLAFRDVLKYIKLIEGKDFWSNMILEREIKESIEELNKYGFKYPLTDKERAQNHYMSTLEEKIDINKNRLNVAHNNTLIAKQLYIKL
ncbi:MAG: hypothetical protein NC181_01780 [Clostridium sp.]|nr:hypothetical protein [Clostridium sp.]MCM1444037.1 hypothetical protein [Candidatus Amulumruptor caecigallinarius]